MGCQVQTGQIQKEESICALKSSSCAAQVLQLISYANSAMPAEVPQLRAYISWNNYADG